MGIRVSELADPQEKSKGQVILDHSNNTVNPVNGVYQGPTNTTQMHIKEGK
ncbi:hypothetical protein RR46_00190 [Papilio xuthus]|uniref:Uncharacterized protein n=1 Tax=Papilio xuthus TaxID=66420 RepID=A0A0N0P9W0_PAPXU|nr:hypothetical protein RR46_00190 [Papilio xuthus]